MDNKYIVRKASLSRLGDLIKEKLGENVENYIFPDDFEQAIIDTGIQGVILEGTEPPYDVIVIGNMSIPYCTYFGNNANTSYLRSVVFIGTGDIPYSLPEGFFNREQLSSNIVLPQNTVELKTNDFNMTKIDSISNLNNLVVLGTNTFGSLTGNIEELNFPQVTTITSDGSFNNSVGLKRVLLPKYTTQTRNIFQSCTGLTYVQLGSIGYPITNIAQNMFKNCTQTGLTIDCYAAQNYIDTAISRIRNNATNATIVIKAPVGLTYNNITYSAGDTVITSTP